MKIFLLLSSGGRVPLSDPGRALTVETPRPCPHCGIARMAVFGEHPHCPDDYSMEARAHCASCRGVVGVLRCQFDSLFGYDEDRAVLKDGRARVYDDNTPGEP